MDADLPTLHVARFASEVDPSLAGGNEGLPRLELLRAVLRRIARDPVVHHPGLVSECAMDSVGALLTKRGSVDAEAHRRALMVGEPPADVRVWLARPAYRSVPIEEARQLSPQVLQDAIPLRNADAVAVQPRADERRREEVRVAFGASGAQLVRAAAADRRRAGGDGGRRARRRARDARVRPAPAPVWRGGGGGGGGGGYSAAAGRAAH